MQKFGFCLQDLLNLLTKLLNRIFRYCTQITSPWAYEIKVCSNGGHYIVSKKIANDNLNVANLKQSLENLHLQNDLTEFLTDILHTNSPWVCVIKVFSSSVVWLCHTLVSVCRCFVRCALSVTAPRCTCI